MWRTTFPCLRLLRLVLLCILPAGAVSATPDPYRVSGIRVDARAESAVAAQKNALVEAKREAFRRLMKRLVVAEDLSRIPAPETVDLAPLVRSFTIEEEKRSTTRYLARVTVVFDPRGIRSLLRRADVRAVLAPTPPLLVLPVLVDQGKADLWSDDNPWRQAWQEHAEDNTFLTLLVPLGDLRDLLALDGRLPPFSSRDVEELAARYGTDTVVTVEARVAERTADAGPRSLELGLRPVLGWLNEPARLVLPAPPPASASGLSEPSIWALGVARLKERMQEAWKRRHAIRLGVEERLQVTIPLADLAQWVQIRRRLEALPELTSLRVERLSRQEVELSIAFLGGRDRLQAALGRLGLQLVQEEDSWQLRRVEDRDRPSVPPSAS